MTRPRSRWFACYQPRPDSRLKLFCLPSAGASAYAYRDWCDWLPTDVELHSAQYPGRGPRIAEDAIEDMARLVEALCDAIAPLVDRPFAIHGHSVGALVAYELALELARRGLPPTRLFASACEPPDAGVRYRPLHLLDDDTLVEELRTLQGTSDDLLDHPSMREVLLPPLRTDFSLGHTFRPSAPSVDCDLTVYGGRADALVRWQALGRWAQFTTARYDDEVFDGDHWFPNEDGPFRATFSRHLRRCWQPNATW